MRNWSLSFILLKASSERELGAEWPRMCMWYRWQRQRDFWWSIEHNSVVVRFRSVLFCTCQLCVTLADSDPMAYFC